MPALTETEARARAALIAVVSYEVFADLTAEPVRSRTEIRFTCAAPGAATFADLTARAVSAVLNGREVGPPDDGRLALTGLAAENTLVVEAEADDVLIRFTDPADDAGYVMFTGYPTLAPSLFCCFDQADLTGTTTLSLVLPAGWECLTNGPVDRAAAGRRGGPVAVRAGGRHPAVRPDHRGRAVRPGLERDGRDGPPGPDEHLVPAVAGRDAAGARAVRRAGAAGAGVLRADAGRALPVPQVRHRVRAPAERAGHLDPRADAGQREPAGPDGRPGRRLRGDAGRARGVAPVVRLSYLGPLVG